MKHHRHLGKCLFPPNQDNREDRERVLSTVHKQRLQRFLLTDFDERPEERTKQAVQLEMELLVLTHFSALPLAAG
ncbi:SCL-interrupting locus protein-like protein [Frankliniella fusca]|uniref:SCL-interrupting locus protein-like protein n=1 Tax=Frankliniella fusca TaxID=407009 RepID=A0AAE1LD73_9NEOP|nr:SCL-interrupting locus protein-like protein [Frankliniella fusca]